MVEYGVLYFVQLTCDNWENRWNFIFECQNLAVIIIETIETNRRRPSLVATGGDLAILSPPKQSAKSPLVEIWNTINHWSFYQIFNIKPTRHKRKAPPHECKAPLLKTSWRRYCVDPHVQCTFHVAKRLKNKNFSNTDSKRRQRAPQKCDTRHQLCENVLYISELAYLGCWVRSWWKVHCNGLSHLSIILSSPVATKKNYLTTEEVYILFK